MTLRWRKKTGAASVVACTGALSLAATALGGQDVLLDQIGAPDGSDLAGGVIASQFFTTPEEQAFDIAAIDDFTASGQITITSVEAVIGFFTEPPEGSSLENVESFTVAVYASAADAGVGLDETVASATFTAPSSTATIGGFDVVQFDVNFELPAGTYWVGVIPTNDFALNGQTGIVDSNLGDGNPMQANPGGGFGFGPVTDVDATGLAYRVLGSITGGSGCPADLDGDETVGVGDLLELLSAWGDCPGCPEDLDDDDTVGVGDLLELLSAWGDCPKEPFTCPGTGDCCSANETPGCEITSCCNTVCDADPSCCDDVWDAACADQALALCAPCAPASGDTCGDAVEVTIDAVDPLNFDTTGNPTPDVGTCDGLTPNQPTFWATVTGTGETLTATACSLDDDFFFDYRMAVFCGSCTDLACLDSADNVTVNCGFEPGEAPVVAPRITWCSEAGVQYFIAVWATSTFVEGPGELTVTAGDACDPPIPSPCGSAGVCLNADGDCCAANGTPGCEDPECCSAVCELDAFCCDDTWDELCAEAAQFACEACINPFTCPSGASDEGVPCQEDGFNADADPNGGCNSDPPQFGSIACGETICGVVSTYQSADGTAVRDTDWYQFAVGPDGAGLTVTGVAQQGDIVFGIVNNDGCAAPAFESFAVTTADDLEVTANVSLPQGDYSIFVAPAAETIVNCGINHQYAVTLECGEPSAGACCMDSGETCEDLSALDCAAAGGLFVEGESCATSACPNYAYDDGGADNGIGAGGGDFAWIHPYEVDGGGTDTITEIHTAVGFANSGVSAGDDLNWAIYQDTNGSPTGATLLQSGTTTVEPGIPDSGLVQTIDIPDTSVNGAFWIAVWVTTPDGVEAFPGPIDTDTVIPNVTWANFAAGGSFTAANVMDGTTLLKEFDILGVWLLRAVGSN